MTNTFSFFLSYVKCYHGNEAYKFISFHMMSMQNPVKVDLV